MKKNTRIKPQPLTERAEFLETVDELAQLETIKRGIEAERDAEIQAIQVRFDKRIAPITERIKGKFALAEAYAEANRGELLPKDAKSVQRTLARFGWRTGNRTVALMSRVTEDFAINALKALGLTGYVRPKEEIARDAILSDCADNKTLLREVRDPAGAVVMKDGEPMTEAVALSDVGLRIKQAETFYIEPKSASDAAETLTPASAAAA